MTATTTSLASAVSVDTQRASATGGLNVYVAVGGLIAINIVSLSLQRMDAVIVAAVVVVAALSTVGRPRLWAGAAAYLTVTAALFWAPVFAQGGLLGLFNTLGFWLFRFGVALLAAAYVIITVTPSAFVSGMYRARVPRFLSVPLAVMLRFIPQARVEFVAVIEAMTLRGIPMTTSAWFRQPLRSIEYLVVPLLVSSSRLADDLTASGLVRGLGGTERPTPMVENRFSWRDWVAVLAIAAVLTFAFWPVGGVR
ncbi:MAG: energy-coupling factor transporter transmembrane component T family protein [Propioniciclava sp.]